ncbi:MAG: hypothetical protein COA32_15685 [Fluviicola sp.]|nr:MAG: hypothetical protein COA32_15685 [Fluviicola sp.]
MSDNNKNIDDIIKGGFDDANDDFNLDSWDDLAERLNKNKDLDKSISAAFSGSEEEIPSSIWSNINDDLDVNTVWNRIDKALTKRKRRAFIWWNAASIAFLLILIGNFFTKLDSNNMVSKYRKESISSSDHRERQIDINSKTLSESTTKEFDNKDLTQGSGSASASSSPANDNYSALLEKKEIKTQENLNSLDQLVTTTRKDDYFRYPVSMLEPLLPNFNVLLLDTQLVAVSSIIDTNNVQSEVANIQPKEEHAKKWIVGIKASLVNSTILDGLSSEANSENSLVSNNFTVSVNPALFAQYNLSNGFFLQSDVYWNYRIKRSVNTYNQLKYVSKTTELDYFKLKLNAGKSLNLSQTSGKLKLNVALGGYWDYLKSQREYRNQTLISEQKSYKSNNFGIASEIAVQHDYNRFSFSYGAQVELGLQNINVSSNKKLNTLNSARTLSYGLFMRLGYRF